MLFNRRNQKNQSRTTSQSLEYHANTVEDILDAIGVEPVQARLDIEMGYGWTFRRGSAVIEIYVSEQDGRGYMQVLSPIMHLPQTGLLPLYRHMLELNLQLTNASLGVYFDVVYVFNERPLEGMDSVEANNVITLVAGYADDLDNTIVNEFGGRLYSQG
jgi:hypothetical protein